MRDRLIELLKNNSHLDVLFGDEWEEAAEELLANGVIVSPVSVGQTVWFFSGVLEEVCEAKVVRIDMNFFTNPSLWMEFEYHSQLIGAHIIRGQIDSLFGKTVFLTKEEAEKALERSGE